MLANKNGTSVTFVMQPFIPWLNKSLASQETELFALLDQEADGFLLVLRELAEYRAQYDKDLHAICSKVGVKYLNLNDAPELQQPDWLFVDRVHMTDNGCDAVARLLVRDLAL
jgi:lysophospholipase L1-like esterase